MITGTQAPALQTADSPHFRYVTSEMIRGLVSHKYVDPTGDTVVALSGARLP